MLTGALEDNVLTLLCWSDVAAHEVAMEVTPALFSTPAYRKIARLAIAYLEEFHRPPKVHLRDLLEEDLRKGGDGKLLKETLDAMENLQADLQVDFVLAGLKDFIELRQFSNKLDQASELLHSGDLEKAKEILHGVVEFKGSPGIWLSDAEAMLSFLVEKEDDYFSCGIDILDNKAIRPFRKELFLLIASKGKGKSWFLVNVGKKGILHRKKVLHLTLEMSEERVAKRYIQALFSMTSEEGEKVVRTPVFVKDELGRCSTLEFRNLSPEGISTKTKGDIKMKIRGLANKPRLLIKEFPMSSLTIAKLNAYLDYLEKVKKFKPDLLVIDYADLMYLDNATLRLDTGSLYRNLRGLATEREMALVTASQGNRKAADAKLVRASHAAEDFSKVTTADVCATLSQTEEEKELGLARVLVAHARNSEDGFIVLISQAYAVGQFCLDSVYMTKDISGEVNRLTGEGAEDE